MDDRLNSMRPPADAIIAVTYRCNAHCLMCNVWKSRETDALRPEHMRKLPPRLKTINLSGGEPFLRKDLPAFVAEARRQCPNARITISTNAYLPRRIAGMMNEIRRIDPAIRLAVSLDGIGAAHDRVRGDEGAFASVMELIDELTAGGFRGLRLSMTLFKDNLDQLLDVAGLARRRGLELGIVAAHVAETHLGLEQAPTDGMGADLKEPFQRIITEWLRSWRPKQWLRAHFAYNTYRYLAGRRWRFRCRAGGDFFFLQADGTVYSCSVRGRPMGNILHQSWQEIWQGPRGQQARDFVSQCPESCWMICTARSIYRGQAWGVIAWIVTHKLSAHRGLLRLPDPAGIPASHRKEELCGADSPH